MLAVRVGFDGLARLEKQFAALQAKAPQAIARGLNEGGDRVRTQVRRSLRQQSGLFKLHSVIARTSTIRAYESAAPKSGIGPVGPASLAYTIVVRGRPSTRPDEFVFKVKKGPGGGVNVKMWGVDHFFKRSFQVAGHTGASGLRMRLGRPREPIRGFDGPNLAEELGKGVTPSVFTFSCAEFVGPAILKHLARALG